MGGQGWKAEEEVGIRKRTEKGGRGDIRRNEPRVTREGP